MSQAAQPRTEPAHVRVGPESRPLFDTSLLVVFLAIAAASLWMRAGFPIHAISTADFDDALSIREAKFLGNGVWLGPYDSLTLVKGMFYPLFVLLSFIASTPLLIAEHFVYLAACGGVALLLGRSAGATLATLLFGLLAFNPVLWNSELNRVIREGLYISLTLGCIGLTIATAFPPPQRSAPRRALMGALLGFVLGAFWLTREEGPWLLPALAVVPAVALAVPVVGLPRRVRAWQMLRAFAVAAAFCSAMLLCVAAVNWRQYGVFLTTEFQGGAFPRAYGALARVTPDHWQRYVVFPADARARAYEVSPAAAELAPVLDGPRGRYWAFNGCALTQTEPCPGILSGWFMWALREAAAEAGHHRTALDAQGYYGRLADQINRACDEGRLACDPPNSGLAPPFRWAYVAETARSAARLAWIMVKVAPDRIGSLPSQGWPRGLAAFADMAGPIAPERTPRTVITGWIADAGAAPQLQVVGPPDEAGSTLLTTQPAPDIAEEHPGSHALRFELQTTCPAGCQLALTGSDGTSLRLAIDGLKAGSALAGPGPKLFVSGIDTRDAASATARLQTIRLRIARVIANAYELAAPPGFILAMVGSLLALARHRHRPMPPRLTAFALAAAIAIGSRLLLLAYLDATAIPSVNELYPSPVSPLVIGFAAVGCWLGWSSLRRRSG